MIQIIKMGQLPAPPYKTTCQYCNTIFTHFEADCDPDVPKNSILKLIECPLCQNMIKAQKRQPDVPPPAGPLKQNMAYDLISNYCIIAKKIFKFNP